MADLGNVVLPDQVVGYGHLGDGNLHLNVSCARYEGAILDRIEPYVYEWTAARRGSISAEHGLGQMKAECIGCCCLPLLETPSWWQLCRQKHVLDTAVCSAPACMQKVGSGRWGRLLTGSASVTAPGCSRLHLQSDKPCRQLHVLASAWQRILVERLAVTLGGSVRTRPQAVAPSNEQSVGAAAHAGTPRRRGLWSLWGASRAPSTPTKS